jgi:hypothetical protein
MKAALNQVNAELNRKKSSHAFAPRRRVLPRGNESRQTAINTAGEPELDWDTAVRSAFLGGCVREAARAQRATEALREGVDPGRERALREAAELASRKAALGWLRLETCLAHYGELAAFALERCLEEAAVEIRLRAAVAPIGSMAPAARSSQVVMKGDAVALSIVQRGRERLARFWQASGFRAA